MNEDLEERLRMIGLPSELDDPALVEQEWWSSFDRILVMIGTAEFAKHNLMMLVTSDNEVQRRMAVAEIAKMFVSMLFVLTGGT